jgi:sulfur carrier protein
MTNTLVVNGDPWDGPVDVTVSQLVAAWCDSPRGIAVARNDEVVPKSRWDDTTLVAGDRIEIVTAAAGG